MIAISVSVFGSSMEIGGAYDCPADSPHVQKESTEDPVTTTTNAEVTEPTAEEKKHIKYYTDQDAVDIAKVLYRECGGVPSTTEQACVVWTVLNRVDHDESTIYDVVRTPAQFAFKESYPVWEDLLELAYDVLERWNLEKNGETNVGRVLPKEYMFFRGDGKHNYFRNGYKGSYDIWDYSLDSPYKS